MLIKFAVTNYRGFADRIEWDLSNPANYEFNAHVIKEGIIKNGIIYGPNGSGKSSFALALFDIVNHLSQKWKKIDYYNNFVYAGNIPAPVIFEYTFRLGEYIIQYKYAKQGYGILVSENMQVNGKEVFNRANGSFKIDEKSYPINNTVKVKIADSANNVSIVNYLLTSYPLPQNHYLILLQQFVNSMLWFCCLETREFIGLKDSSVNLDEYIINNNLVKDFSCFIEEVSDQKFTFLEPDANEKVLYCLYGNTKIPFDKIASTGTCSLMLLYYWIKQMERASFVFIDEFDAFYHFRLAFEVCKRLFKMDCQIFTSSHNTYLMTNELLRPDCNFILNENKIKPLNECTEKELRFGHNIEKLFRGGTFAV